MLKIIIKSVLYLINLILFSPLVFADDSAHYIIYNNSLFDRDGNVIIENSQEINTIKYQDPYWIVQPNSNTRHTLHANVSEIDNFKYSFEKKGNVLTFKIGENLTYLGAQRIAYRYWDTALLVLLDIDGNLMTPKGIYYKNIGPFVNDYAKVTTENNKNGYLNIQGEFIPKLPEKTQLAEPQLSKIDTNCEVITADQVMQLCKKNNSQYLVNTTTGKEVNVGSDANIISHHSGYNNYKNNDSAGYFWLSNYIDRYHIYQIYDYDGQMHYENEFSNVSRLYSTVSWVTDVSGKYRLIDITGKTLAKYDYYHETQMGKDKLYFVKKKKTKNRSENEKESVLLSILDVNGNILFYEDIVGTEHYSFCNRNFKVLKNREDKIVWPVDLEKECLLERYIGLANTNKFNSYNDKAKEKIEIPKDKIPEISRYFMQIRLSGKRNKTTDSRLWNYQVGPNPIKIDDIAELSIPNGYIYNESKSPVSNDSYCERFVIPAYDQHNRLCINIYKIGYVNLAEAKKEFNMKTNIDAMKAKIEKTVNQKNDNVRYQNFEWLIDPEFDFDNQSLKFGYRYQLDNGIENKVSQVIKYIKFTKDKMIVMQNDEDDDYNDFKPIEFDWIKRLKVFEKADITSTYPCSKLSLNDSALKKNFAYLSREYCFPLSVTRLMDNDRELEDYVGKFFTYLEQRYSIK